jgi:hypothetical protein
MRRWAALAGAVLTGYVCFAAQFVENKTTAKPEALGRSFVTQAGAVANPPMYDTYFGDNWGSVRVFPLMAPCPPLKVFVNTQSSLYSPQYLQYIAWSLNSWSQALYGRLSYQFTPNRYEADITVDWVPRFSDQYIAGLTTFQVGHADIQIKTVGVPEKDIKANIIHEFGHALGIAGHSENDNDIMVGSRHWRRGADAEHYEPKLSRNDIQAIRRLYSITWRRGEDLYSPIAQRAVLPTTEPGSLAVEPGSRVVNSTVTNVINLQPLEDQVNSPRF